MAFNYFEPEIHFSLRRTERRRQGDCWWLHQHFLRFSRRSILLFHFAPVPFFALSPFHRQLKKRYIFVETVFSFYSFWHIRKWKMIRHLSTEIEADILYRWRDLWSEHISQNRRGEKKVAAAQHSIINELLSCCLLYGDSQWEGFIITVWSV